MIPDCALTRRPSTPARDHVLDEEADTLLDEPQVGDKTRPHTLSGFQPIASEATDAGCIYEGTELSAAELAHAAEERSNAERFMDDLVRDEAPLTLLPLHGHVEERLATKTKSEVASLRTVTAGHSISSYRGMMRREEKP